MTNISIYFMKRGIQFEVVCVKPNEDQVLAKLNLTVKAIDVRSSFIFFCRKMQSEYTTLKSLLNEDQTAYSDMFEIRTWGVTRKTLAFALKIEGVPKLNEHLHVVSPNGSIGRVDNHVKNEDENVSINYEVVFLTSDVLIIKLICKSKAMFLFTNYKHLYMLKTEGVWKRMDLYWF